MSKILVIGYGNPLRADDGLGCHVARQIGHHLRGDERVSVVACHQLDPDTTEQIAAAEFVIFVDACTDGEPGTITQTTVLPDPEFIGKFGDGMTPATLLATAKALSIAGLADAGILHSRIGRVRLLRRDELPEDWDPAFDNRLTVWEVTQHLIHRLDKQGEAEAANLKAKIGGMAEIARDLAYRLYTLCERKGWAEEAGYYNSLVVAWPSMASEPFELD